MKTALLALALLAAAPTRAEENGWFQRPNTVDIVGQSLVTGLILADWMTTTNGLYHRRNMSEWNPVLGPHPSRTKLNLFVPAAMLGHAAVSYALPRPWRNVWQCVFIVVEAGAVRGNMVAGAGFSLPWN